jgi:hypothetical protein
MASGRRIDAEGRTSAAANLDIGKVIVPRA